jgi:hypothetical protein
VRLAVGQADGRRRGRGADPNSLRIPVPPHELRALLELLSRSMPGRRRPES